MIRTGPAALAIASLGILVSASACARQQEATYAAQDSAMVPAAGPAAASPAVDPAVITALNKMGAFLRAQRAFAVRSETAIDEILDTGQKIQLGEAVEMWVRRPNGLRVNYVADRKQRQFFYNGKTFTLYAPKIGFYAAFAAPPMLRELIDVLEQRYQIEMPLVDLFYWGTDKSGIDKVDSAIDLG